MNRETARAILRVAGLSLGPIAVRYFEMIGEGYTQKEAAKILGIAPRTARVWTERLPNFLESPSREHPPKKKNRPPRKI
jgi:transposase